MNSGAVGQAGVLGKAQAAAMEEIRRQRAMLKQKETEVENAIVQRGQQLLNIFEGVMNG